MVRISRKKKLFSKKQQVNVAANQQGQNQRTQTEKQKRQNDLKTAVPPITNQPVRTHLEGLVEPGKARWHHPW